MTLPTGTADVLASDRLVVQTCQKKKSSLVISNDFFLYAVEQNGKYVIQQELKKDAA